MTNRQQKVIVTGTSLDDAERIDRVVSAGMVQYFDERGRSRWATRGSTISLDAEQEAHLDKHNSLVPVEVDPEEVDFSEGGETIAPHAGQLDQEFIQFVYESSRDRLAEYLDDNPDMASHVRTAEQQGKGRQNVLKLTEERGAIIAGQDDEGSEG